MRLVSLIGVTNISYYLSLTPSTVRLSGWKWCLIAFPVHVLVGAVSLMGMQGAVRPRSRHTLIADKIKCGIFCRELRGLRFSMLLFIRKCTHARHFWGYRIYLDPYDATYLCPFPLVPCHPSLISRRASSVFTFLVVKWVCGSISRILPFSMLLISAW